MFLKVPLLRTSSYESSVPNNFSLFDDDKHKEPETRCSLYFFQDKTLVIKCLSLSKPRDIEEGTIIGTVGPESNFLKN